MLTEKQYSLLLYIYKFQKENGICPSYDDMCREVNIKSKSTVSNLIKALVERGYCQRLENRARAIEVIRVPEALSTAYVSDNTASIEYTLGESHISIQYFGEIAAGKPLENFYPHEEAVDVPESLMGPTAGYPDQFFALKILGDSMVEAGICDGDTVILKRAQTAPIGAIVAALVDDNEITLKRFNLNHEGILLEPANRDHVAQLYAPERVKILGKLYCLQRRYDAW